MSSTTPDIIAVMGETGYRPLLNDTISVSSLETLSIGVDVSAQLAASNAFPVYYDPTVFQYLDTPTNLTCTLLTAAGTVIALPSAPYLQQYTLVQLLPGSLLTPGQGYTLRFTWQDNAGASTYLAVVRIRCPF